MDMVLDQAQLLVALCVIVIIEIIVTGRSGIGIATCGKGNAIATVCASGTTGLSGDHSAEIMGIVARESAIVATGEEWSEMSEIIRWIEIRIADARRDSAMIVDGLTVILAIRTNQNGSAQDLRLNTILSSSEALKIYRRRRR